MLLCLLTEFYRNFIEAVYTNNYEYLYNLKHVWNTTEDVYLSVTDRAPCGCETVGLATEVNLSGLF